jgi:hypothetical protein
MLNTSDDGLVLFLSRFGETNPCERVGPLPRIWDGLRHALEHVPAGLNRRDSQERVSGRV